MTPGYGLKMTLVVVVVTENYNNSLGLIDLIPVVGEVGSQCLKSKRRKHVLSGAYIQLKKQYSLSKQQ